MPLEFLVRFQLIKKIYIYITLASSLPIARQHLALRLESDLLGEVGAGGALVIAEQNEVLTDDASVAALQAYRELAAQVTGYGAFSREAGDGTFGGNALD